MGPIQHGDVGKAARRVSSVVVLLRIQHIDTADLPVDLLCGKNRLPPLIRSGHDTHDRFAAAVRLHPPRSARIVGNDGEGSGENLPGGPIIFFQPDGMKLRKILLQLIKAGRVRAPEAVDGLIRISDHKKFCSIPVPCLHQTVLQRVDVLKLVDQKTGKTGTVLIGHRFLLFQQAKRLQEQIIIVHYPLLLHGLLVKPTGFHALIRFRLLPLFALRLCHPVFHTGKIP